MTPPISKQIGVLIFDGFNALDVFGPLEVFAIAKEQGFIDYTICLIGAVKGEYTTESHIRVLSDCPTSHIKTLDTLILPGGKGAREHKTHQQHKQWLQAMLINCRRVVSICTGAYLLASTEALNNKKATTHWHYVDDFQQHFPLINVVSDALYIDHGNIATSAGITSGIDLALKLIEDDCGSTAAIKVARFLVMHYRRAGNQAQFSEPLQYQSQCSQTFSNLTAWILNNLSENMTIAHLAAQACMSERTFSRKFKQEMGKSPAQYVALLRLDQARQLLTNNTWPIEKISHVCGYKNVEVFRRAFERKFIIAPNIYRARFSA